MDTINYIQAHRGVPGIRNAFVRAFRSVFAGAPYFQWHSHRYIRKNVWRLHMGRGVIVLAVAGKEVIGFGCMVPLTDPLALDILELLEREGFSGSPEQVWYMSELGVREEYRGRGIGAMLIQKRLQLIQERGGTHYCLQTALHGSHSEPLYRKIGATEFGQDEETESKYLIGSCEEALSKLQAAD